MNKRIKYIRLIAAFALLANHTTHAAVNISLAGDYSTAGATFPTGWQYLYSDAATGGNEQNLLYTNPITNTTNEGWAIGPNNGAANDYGTPAIVGRATPGDELEIFNGNYNLNTPLEGTDLAVHPGDSTATRIVIMRYTVQSSDVLNFESLTISGSVQRMSNASNGITFSLYHNSNVLLSRNGAGGSSDIQMTAAEGAYTTTLTNVSVGDTFSFVIDSNGFNNSDESALSGNLSFIPEPATYALTFGGLALGFVILRRRI